MESLSPAISVSSVVKRYRRTVAVNQVSFAVPQGSICALVGPNGAGKSSCIRMLLGLIRPTAGRLQIGGLDPSSHSFTVRQRVGYVPEQHNVYPWMRLRQVLSFGKAVYPTWDPAEADRLVARLDLPMNRRVRELSRGQTVKLALTIALAHHPRILILDEPTSGLDPLVRIEFLDLVRELAVARDDGGAGCSVLFSTHILSDVERIADRVVVMHQGRIAADEPLHELRSRYFEASLLFRTPPREKQLAVPQAVRVDRSLREWLAIFPRLPEQRIRQIASEVGADDCMIRPAPLDAVFPELVRSNGDPAGPKT